MFYFACYPEGDQSRITVIDLADAVAYQKSDWSPVDPLEFSDRNEAILHARKLASRYDLSYEMFDSRYDEEMSEYLGEFPEVRENHSQR